jgi:hypothetical protein
MDMTFWLPQVGATRAQVELEHITDLLFSGAEDPVPVDKTVTKTPYHPRLRGCTPAFFTSMTLPTLPVRWRAGMDGSATTMDAWWSSARPVRTCYVFHHNAGQNIWHEETQLGEDIAKEHNAGFPSTSMTPAARLWSETGELGGLGVWPEARIQDLCRRPGARLRQRYVR